jgi:hypothetical protein
VGSSGLARGMYREILYNNSVRTKFFSEQTVNYCGTVRDIHFNEYHSSGIHWFQISAMEKMRLMNRALNTSEWHSETCTADMKHQHHALGLTEKIY